MFLDPQLVQRHFLFFFSKQAPPEFQNTTKLHISKCRSRIQSFVLPLGPEQVLRTVPSTRSSWETKDVTHPQHLFFCPDPPRGGALQFPLHLGRTSPYLEFGLPSIRSDFPLKPRSWRLIVKLLEVSPPGPSFFTHNFHFPHSSHCSQTAFPRVLFKKPAGRQPERESPYPVSHWPALW